MIIRNIIPYTMTLNGLRVNVNVPAEITVKDNK